MDLPEPKSDISAVREAEAESLPATLGEIGLDRFAPYLMNRVMGRWNADIQKELREFGLTTAQMRALAVLSVIPGLTIMELSVYTVTEQSTMSRTLDGLESQGYVRRIARADDARAREIFLTDAGAAAFARVWPLMRDAYEKMLAGIGEEEREAFLGTLRKIMRNVRKHNL
ncbi:MarR family transcriptional regulator [Stappia sp. GBMRC 2046]|uniref:MarR family transcriptional regulator n=1 Tax=Stappia sediminis TaxID=2692190 RepID=A0A7X3S5S3_9HYPH|nr:MarR family transcriptional regulator [Stappia sediminis]MXN63448.1 MarR family transcriptional regulator [Stappia sediminis]